MTATEPIANGTTVTLPVAPSPAVVNAILKWPEDDRLALAQLLLDSVKEKFDSLEEVERRDNEMIRQRVEAYERGEVQATDWRESMARVEARFLAEFPQ